MIKAVLFDFDDTLVKTKEVRYDAIKEAGKKFYGLSIKTEDIDKSWGKPFDIFISELFKNLDTPDVLTSKYKSILTNYPNKPIKDTDEVINLLSKKYILGIVSSSNPALIESGLKDVNLNPKLFSFIQSSKDTNIHKPSPEVFKPSLERLKLMGVSELETIYVGDAFDDYYAAVNAGLHFCGLANRTVVEKKFKDSGVTYIIDIKKLPKYIENIRSIDIN